LAEDKEDENPSKDLNKNVEKPEAKDGEVIPGSQYNEELARETIVALITEYTERPDLLIDAIERHDPGFIKKMNDLSLERNERSYESRFKFGEKQAYRGMYQSEIAAIAVFIALFALIFTKQISLFNFLGLGIFYAITQGGEFGFHKIIDSIGEIASRLKGKGD